MKIDNKNYILSRVGDMNQCAGTKIYELCNGRGKGVRCVDVRNGNGLSFTVSQDRGMDISFLEYRGIPACFVSKSGAMSSSERYEPTEIEWIRNFFAGMLTTCGLQNVGPPAEAEHYVFGKQSYGLHGRISNIPAQTVCVDSEWIDNDYITTIKGKIRQSVFLGENLLLKRCIKTTLKRNALTIYDEVKNEGFAKQQLMILYHINIGYPVLDVNSQFIVTFVI